MIFYLTDLLDAYFTTCEFLELRMAEAIKHHGYPNNINASVKSLAGDCDERRCIIDSFAKLSVIVWSLIAGHAV